MLDIKLIRENSQVVRENIKRRNNPEKLKQLDELIVCDKKWRELQTKVNLLRQKRNQISLEISKLKKEGKTVKKKVEDGKEVDVKIEKTEKQLEEFENKERNLLMGIPNLLHESVPDGKDESDNVEVRRWGKQPKFDFEPKDHLTILQNLGLIDMERAAKVAGNGFFFLKNELVLLDMAIQRFALDFLIRNGFTIIEPPLMVNKESYEGVAPLQDFMEMMYKVQDYDLFLIATAEHPMGSMFRNETIDKKELPLKLAGVSPCFRKELGAHGKYTKGFFRMHQFNKIEQFVYCHPDDSWKLFEEIQKNSEKLYQELGIHHRVIEICTGDIGIMKAKSFDIEFWMADGNFREIGSNSNLTDYSARNLNIKWREGPGKPPAGFVHTLNNTALATSRTIIAIIEQFQQKDGSVLIPKVLRDYMNGIERLEKKLK
jgi:seryl-tRNA synthetase